MASNRPRRRRGAQLKPDPLDSKRPTMPTIMCTKDLWNVLGAPSRLVERDRCDLHDTLLGAWSAKAITFPEGDFLVAVNELTYLGLVVPLAPIPRLLSEFGHSVGSLLQALGYDDDLVRSEAEPFLLHTAFAKNSNRSLIGTLNDLCIHVDAAFQAEKTIDRAALLRVQLHLSQIPHVNRDCSFPREAAALLFSEAANA